jgi:hypothetical protein
MNNLKKWPEDWDTHIIKSCELYFIDKKNNFLNYKEVNECDTNNLLFIKIKSIQLEFEYNGEYYITDMMFFKDFLTTICYYKDYNNIDKKIPIPIIPCTEPIFDYDTMGIYTYVLIEEFFSHFNKYTALDCVKKIESIIIDHQKNNDNDDGYNNGGGREKDNNPTLSPSDLIKPSID